MMHAAGSIVATGSNATQDESFAFPPVTHTAPFGVAEQPGSAVERNARQQPTNLSSQPRLLNRRCKTPVSGSIFLALEKNRLRSPGFS